jgi:hypothetical protein
MGRRPPGTGRRVPAASQARWPNMQISSSSATMLTVAFLHADWGSIEAEAHQWQGGWPTQEHLLSYGCCIGSMVRRALSSLSLSEFLCAGQTTVPAAGNIEESVGFGNHGWIRQGGR